MERKTACLVSRCVVAGLLAFGGSGFALAAHADDTAPPITVTPVTPNQAGAAPAAPSDASGGATAAAQVPAASDNGVVPGPLEQARKILIDRIQLAKSEGIGITNYMMAFRAIEDSVKAGQTAEQLQPRVESLARALKDQLDKGKILKTQRPVPGGPSGGSPGPMAGGPPGGGPGAGGLPPGLPPGLDLSKLGAGGANKDALLQKLKEKLGAGGINQIPEGFRDRIPKDILDKLGQ